MKTKVLLLFVLFLSLVAVIGQPAEAEVSATGAGLGYGISFHPSEDGYGTIWRIGSSLPNAGEGPDHMGMKFYRNGELVGEAVLDRRTFANPRPDEKILLGNRYGFGLELMRFDRIGSYNLRLEAEGDDGDTYKGEWVLEVEPHISNIEVCRIGAGFVRVGVTAQYFNAQPRRRSIQMSIGDRVYNQRVLLDEGFTIVRSWIPRVDWEAGYPYSHVVWVRSVRPDVLSTSLSMNTRFDKLPFCSLQ